MKNLKTLLLFAILGSCCSACYRMPTDDDFCVIPTTNNPNVTHEKPASLMPGAKY